jgi:hypothetical protein
MKLVGQEQPMASLGLLADGIVFMAGMAITWRRHRRRVEYLCSPQAEASDRQGCETGVFRELRRMIKSLWASVQGDPVFMRRVNGWLTLVWLGMIPVSLATGWVKSVTYVSALSLWALVSGHWSAWQAARVEVNQEVLAKREAEKDVATDVVQKIVAETEVEPA